MAEKTTASLTWVEGMRFLARSDSGHGIVLDSKNRPNHAGPTPMELMVMSVAGCTAMDVVAILQKMRQPLTGLEVAIEGERADTNPKRYTAITLVYRVKGTGIDREKVERAVALSHSTYCSASASMRPDIAFTHRIELIES